MIYKGTVKKGHGGASKCFVFADERRINEIQNAIGHKPVPGSLNITLAEDFDWINHTKIKYSIMDVVKRPSLHGEWDSFPCNFYPCVVIKGDKRAGAWAMRFDKDIDRYAKNFIELVSPHKLRDVLSLKDGDIVDIKVSDDV